MVRHDDCRDIGIILDGGNVVACKDYMVLTEKVFRENWRLLYDADFCSYLETSLCRKLILLPWHCDFPQDSNADVYGHADGFVQWTGGNKILMSNHREFDPEEADEIRRRLEDAGFEVTEMLFDVPNPNKDFNWAYINYLRVGNKIIVPTFGIPEDQQALRYIREANPECLVRGFRMRNIARNGGALHCITWDIIKNPLPLESEEERAGENAATTTQLISPYQENAFTPYVLHMVVNQGIGYYLPDEIWEVINDAFENYWDHEVGLGGYFGNDSMYFSFRNWLTNACCILPNDLLYKIVMSITSFIDSIPGVVIHDE